MEQLLHNFQLAQKRVNILGRRSATETKNTQNKSEREFIVFVSISESFGDEHKNKRAASGVA